MRALKGRDIQRPGPSAVIRREGLALALAAPVPAGLGSRQSRRPHLARSRERLPPLLQHVWIRDRPTLTWRPGVEGLSNCARRPAAASPSAAGQPIESVANLSELRTQLVILSSELPVLSLKALVGSHDLRDLVDNRAANS